MACLCIQHKRILPFCLIFNADVSKEKITFIFLWFLSNGLARSFYCRIFENASINWHANRTVSGALNCSSVGKCKIYWVAWLTPFRVCGNTNQIRIGIWFSPCCKFWLYQNKCVITHPHNGEKEIQLLLVFREHLSLFACVR